MEVALHELEDLGIRKTCGFHFCLLRALSDHVKYSYPMREDRWVDREALRNERHKEAIIVPPAPDEQPLSMELKQTSPTKPCWVNSQNCKQIEQLLFYITKFWGSFLYIR